MTKNIINRQTRSDSFLMETKQLLTEFYQQDNIHRIAPGKRDTVTANGKEKLQKRHLYMPIKETYAVLKDKYPNAKIGISKFASVQPSEVLLSSQVFSNVCTCIYHQNMILSLDAIHNYFPTIPTYNKEFSATCITSPEEESCWFSKCKHEFCGFQDIYPKPDNANLLQKAVKWFKWEFKNGCISKLEQTGTLGSLYNYTASAMSKFLKHGFINKKQTESYQLDKEEAQSFDFNTMMLQMDFAENYALQHKMMSSLHTGSKLR